MKGSGSHIQSSCYDSNVKAVQSEHQDLDLRFFSSSPNCKRQDR